MNELSGIAKPESDRVGAVSPELVARQFERLGHTVHSLWDAGPPSRRATGDQGMPPRCLIRSAQWI